MMSVFRFITVRSQGRRELTGEATWWFNTGSYWQGKVREASLLTAYGADEVPDNFASPRLCKSCLAAGTPSLEGTPVMDPFGDQ